MAVIEKFLGHRVEIPDGLHYHVKQGLWAKKEKDKIVFGFTQPALILLGGIKGIEWLIEDKSVATAGESIIFAITGKILYLEAPIEGTIFYNDALVSHLQIVSNDPYDQGWLFKIEPLSDIEKAYQSQATVDEYLEGLRATEGFKNPEGLKGGVSGICKAVYTGIGAQKL